MDLNIFIDLHHMGVHLNIYLFLLLCRCCFVYPFLSGRILFHFCRVMNWLTFTECNLGKGDLFYNTFYTILFLGRFSSTKYVEKQKRKTFTVGLQHILLNDQYVGVKGLYNDPIFQFFIRNFFLYIFFPLPYRFHLEHFRGKRNENFISSFMKICATFWKLRGCEGTLWIIFLVFSLKFDG